ncbi:MAG: hypothetical protein LC650_01970 [Actinobacteria bacterium]|nr:hypothetical protein [Actinomycetota bacterium]
MKTTAKIALLLFFSLVLVGSASATNLSIIDTITSTDLDTAFGVSVVGDYAYVASYTADSLTVIDVSDPASISITDTITSTDLDGATGVSVVGDYAYVASSVADSLTVIDVSNPASISITDTITSTDLDDARSVSVVGDYAYVASYTADSLTVIDVSNPASISITDTITSTDLDGAHSVSVVGDYAYVASSVADSLTVIDVSNPASISITDTITSTDLDNAFGVSVVGDYAYVASYTADSLTVIDVSDPASISITDTITSTDLDGAHGVSVVGDYAYVASLAADSLTVIDVSNPASISITDTITSTDLGSARSVSVVGDYAYVASSVADSLTVIDVSYYTINNFSISASNAYDSTALQSFNATITFNGSTWTQNTTNGEIVTNITGDTGNVNVTVTAEDYFTNSTAAHNTTASLDQTLTPWTAIRAENARTNATLTTFNVTYDNTTYTTTTGEVRIPLYNETTSITVAAAGYSSETPTVTADPHLQNTTVSLYPDPSSVRITLYNADTGASLSGTSINITVSGPESEDTYTTTTGTQYVANLTAGDYSFKFSGANYTTRTYIVSVGNGTTQTLDAYLTTSTEEVLFTVQDSSTDAAIESASVTMSSYVNGSLVVVQSQLTDIAGQVVFIHTENLKYVFTISATNYTSKQFSLDPIKVQPGSTTASYTIRMDPTVSLTDTQAYSGYSVVYTPKKGFSEGGSYNLTWTVTSASGSLSAYNATVCAPGAGCTTQTGTNSGGESLVFAFNITGAEFLDTVNVSSSAAHEIATNNIGNRTWTTTTCPEYGLGKWDCSLIGTGLVVSMAGMATFYAGGVPGLIVALLVSVLNVYLGFFTLWSVLIPVLLGFGYLAFGGGK